VEISEILNDFKRRYEESYIWVAPPNSNDEESLFFVNKITSDRKSIANLELTSPEYGKIILNMGTAHTLKFKYPPVGVFQNGKDAYMFRRIPAKQYKYGLYNGNSLVVPVFNMITAQSIRPSRDQLKFDDVLAAFRGEQYTFNDAIKMLGSGKYRAVALRRNFSLCLSPLAKENYVLLHWETPVAIVDVSGNVLFMYEKSFESVIKQVKEA
jgi:hypothetical protein